MVSALSSRRRFLVGTTLVGAGFFILPTAAMADCVSQAPVNPNQVVCDNPGTAGFNGAATNNLIITLNAGSTTLTNVGV